MACDGAAPLRIVYLLPSSALAGGIKVALQQADALAARGHAVTVVSPEPPPRWYPRPRAAFEMTPAAGSAALTRAQAVVATFWTTVPAAVARARGAVFHLCQGFEADLAFYAPRRDEILAAYRLPTRKLAVSPHLRDRLEAEGLGPVRLVGQTFDAEEFRCPGRDFAARPLRLLLPGISVGEVKGVPEALAALARLRAKGAEFLLRRVAAELPTPEEASGPADEYHRAVPCDRMPALYGATDLFVGPSHAEEGFDLPALEALAAGVPCALSDTPAHRNTAGESAVFFPPLDSGAIEHAVARLLDDEGLRRRLAAEGPERAARFRTSDVADALEAAFGEAAGA